ncbi:MAG TPA: alpha/beta hydrolase, partial [Steroidobacteraceae bacterium]|nr:alpha/beta hydrolase [Steroidobacteraceae bacterium]
MSSQRTHRRGLRKAISVGFYASLLLSGGLTAQTTRTPAAVQIDADGTVLVPSYAIPPSEFLSAEGRAYLRNHLKPDPSLLQARGPDNGIPPLIAGYLKRQQEVFVVERRDISLGGVHAYDYMPTKGVSARNRHRVLINLHGGGFMGCWPGCAELESIPTAALGQIRVVSLDYRQSPRFKHPAASEDVAAAYRELLKTYRPENIGIYGCSAGGMLTGMAVAWFQKENLPAPGAIGVLCAGLSLAGGGFGGDSAYTAIPTGEGRAPPSPQPGAPGRLVMPYFAGVSPQDPLAAPASSMAVLARFPPT